MPFQLIRVSSPLRCRTSPISECLSSFCIIAIKLKSISPKFQVVSCLFFDSIVLIKANSWILKFNAEIVLTCPLLFVKKVCSTFVFFSWFWLLYFVIVIFVWVLILKRGFSLWTVLCCMRFHNFEQFNLVIKIHNFFKSN